MALKVLVGVVRVRWCCTEPRLGEGEKKCIEHCIVVTLLGTLMHYEGEADYCCHIITVYGYN